MLYHAYFLHQSAYYCEYIDKNYIVMTTAYLLLPLIFDKDASPGNALPTMVSGYSTCILI